MAVPLAGPPLAYAWGQEAAMDEYLNGAHVALERMIHQATGATRFTQDSPILPDVWIRYGTEGRTQDLLLTPNWRSSAVVLAHAVERRLTAGLSTASAVQVRRDARLAHTHSTVVVRLSFQQLIGRVLGLSRWWHHYLIEPDHGTPAGELGSILGLPEQGPILRAALLGGLTRLADRSGAQAEQIDLATGAVMTAANRQARHVTDDLIWLVQLAGTLARLLADFPAGLGDPRAQELGTPSEVLKRYSGPPSAVLDAFCALFADAPRLPAEEPLWSVNRNRRVSLAMMRSTATVKADAARKVFGIGGQDVRWAVVDSGIDARHHAFRRRTAEDAPHSLGDGDFTSATRILATYDFTRARDLLSVHTAEELQQALGSPSAPVDRGAMEALIAQTAEHGVIWEQWEPLLRIPHLEPGYRPPPHKHGTHVAGILAADWRVDDDPDDALEPVPGVPVNQQVRRGICPEIELYDIRVMDERGECDEFALIAALQFIRAVNARHEHMEIHGVNLSLSLFHDVANFACGRTPICEECERLVASGMVVVAAAGNEGRARYLSAEGHFDEGYRSISITDPGNARSVITVGATHRSDPHGYGVSYFSSRGPTGDGRIKPDLVAPGEKIVAPVPGDHEEAMDGTSMAAPHVSGAAALLLCRHPELSGRPAEIKRILCETAIDLGRERYFQGAGLLDILHALEST